MALPSALKPYSVVKELLTGPSRMPQDRFSQFDPYEEHRIIPDETVRRRPCRKSSLLALQPCTTFPGNSRRAMQKPSSERHGAHPHMIWELEQLAGYPAYPELRELCKVYPFRARKIYHFFKCPLVAMAGSAAELLCRDHVEGSEEYHEYALEHNVFRTNEIFVKRRIADADCEIKLHPAQIPILGAHLDFDSQTENEREGER